MQATVVSRIHITADQQVVFEYLSNPKLHSLWNPHLRRITAKKKLQLGSTYTTDSMVLNIKLPAKIVVTKYDEPCEIEFTNNSGTFRWRVNYRAKPNGGESLVVCTTTVTTDSKAHIFTIPVMKRLARHELQADMRALKIAAEHRMR